MKRNFWRNVIYLLLVVAIAACGGKKQEEGSASDEFDDAQEGDSNVEALEEVIYNIPPPSEIPYLLQTTGAEFNEGILNPYARVDDYMTTFDVTALNLGVYAADLGYLSSYEKTQDAINYLNSMKKLAEFIGASTAYDASMLSRFETNLGERDSLNKIIDEGMTKADELLKGENRGNIAALMTTGSFVEGLYISTQLIRRYPEGLLTEEQKFTVLTPLIQVVLEQRNSLDDLIKLASSAPQEERLTTVIGELRGLSETYAQLDIDDKMAENQMDELLNDETLNMLADQIEKIRGSITQ